MSLRQQLNDSMKDALKAKDAKRLSTLRLVLAALKDRDIAARGRGKQDGIANFWEMTKSFPCSPR
jgi:uncharacterized protein YqeY